MFIPPEYLTACNKGGQNFTFSTLFQNYKEDLLSLLRLCLYHLFHLFMVTEKDLNAAEHYKQLYMAERDKHNRCEKKLDSMDRKLDTIQTILANQAASCETSNIADDLTESDPKWDEWLKFCDAVGDFDTQLNQYILVTDAVPNAELECYSTLKSVAWKMILDCDPMSEEEGFYREFTSKEGGMTNLVSMFTPAELKKSTMRSLVRQIDPQKTQWLFVNGRAGDDDGVCKEFSEWETSSVKDISSFFRCCSDPETFDELKPVVCLILPVSDHSRPYLEVTLSRLIENFNKHKVTFVSVGNKTWNPKKISIQAFDLCPKIINLGLKAVLGMSTDQKLCMPTSHAGVPVNLSRRRYLYIKEYLHVLHIGCENLPEDTSNPSESQGQQEKYLEEQRKSFLSGNEISFASLFDNHDAKREIERSIQIHVQRLLDQGLARPMIVEIRHSPGAGGTTIARRVLWDLHKEYPCVLMDVSSQHYSDEDNIFVNELAERIASLEEICNTTPLILFDGKHSGATEGLSNKLTRILQSKGKRALILRCLRGSKASSKETQEWSHVHKVFHVNVKLEESVTDLNEFKSKYKEYLDTIDGLLVKKHVISGLCRVFHFPLLSMMEEFRPKLEKIIEDTFNELGGIQQEIAVVVAFLQKYANSPTPAILLHEAFKQYIRMPDKKIATYDNVKELFSEYLMNLMIPAKTTSLGSKKPPELYTFQHPLVADLVLKRVYREQKRDLFDVVERFLQFPIYQREQLLRLVDELFIFNKTKQGQTEKLKFSVLFEELKVIDSNRAAEVFCKAAEKTNHPVMYGNAARFCAKKEPPLFPEAKKLINRALQVHKSTSKGRYKNLCHTKGFVLSFELKHMINSNEVENLARLEEVASKALDAYGEAHTFPPTYPHPLIGEVEVWLDCITWIMNNICSGDAEETLAYLTNLSPPFFRTCVSDSFRLLDIVDDIVQSVAHLSDPEETKRLCNNLRLSLMKTFPRRFSSLGKRKANDIVQACRAICTTKHFRESSQLELKRLQAQFMLSNSEPIDGWKKTDKEFLLQLLEDLVVQEAEYHLAHHLMKVCMLLTGTRCYTLERGLYICEKWQVASSHDCLPYFYQMAICFLKIIDGNTLEYVPQYIQALGKCQEKSQSHLRRPYPSLFVGKEEQGMSRLISYKTLLRGETDYATDNFEKVSRFWQVESRKKLLECKGRIRVKQSSSRGKSQPYIELVQGNLELYVGKNADIGKVERDFTPGALVYFVVSFNLQGPVANGITFAPQNPSSE